VETVCTVFFLLHTLQIVGYRGPAVVVVSCVTKDAPFRAHPHNLVGKEGCKKGICTTRINNETMTVSFSNLGIQCVKKKDIEDALKLREEIRVDPFRCKYTLFLSLAVTCAVSVFGH
jgi:Rel/ankyrin family protein